MEMAILRIQKCEAKCRLKQLLDVKRFYSRYEHITGKIKEDKNILQKRLRTFEEKLKSNRWQALDSAPMPHCLSLGKSHSFSESGSSHSVPDRPDGESGTEEEEPGPAPHQRQRCDRVLELLERAEERDMEQRVASMCGSDGDLAVDDGVVRLTDLCADAGRLGFPVSELNNPEALRHICLHQSRSPYHPPLKLALKAFHHPPFGVNFDHYATKNPQWWKLLSGCRACPNADKQGTFGTAGATGRSSECFPVLHADPVRVHLDVRREFRRPPTGSGTESGEPGGRAIHFLSQAPHIQSQIDLMESQGQRRRNQGQHHTSASGSYIVVAQKTLPGVLEMEASYVWNE
ncbi:hypothetical protein D4764_14G0001750 [Takifugu flavidus]|uniref:Uncharacterized protein n=1 Tax=Takifugu flavidus TaxID=433684 RepID=A0A5C6P308_9TELE|nr:hypothetical protein D4764_14G0001750 [Takifugu flavidus]